MIDFEDVIVRATAYVESGRYKSPYRHILVDEFQDISAAKEKGIPFQEQALGATSPTDARVVQVSHGGVATGVISVPLRYMHTPAEVMRLDDVQATIDLVCEYCRRIRPDTDFTPR